MSDDAQMLAELEEIEKLDGNAVETLLLQIRTSFRSLIRSGNAEFMDVTPSEALAIIRLPK